MLDVVVVRRLLTLLIPTALMWLALVPGKCKARTSANRKKRRCTRWERVRGSFTVAGKAGRNSLTFRGRIGGRKLKVGSYRLNGTATDPAGNTSVPRNKAFRIVR